MATHNAAIHTIPQSGYIRRFRLAELLGVSVSTIDRKVRSGTAAPGKAGREDYRL
jgi:predicted DNA-binding transcriptional regulator AlpA